MNILQVVVQCPPSSPDLTSLDFFLWGHLKSRVYADRPNKLKDLQARIRAEIQLLTPNVVSKVCICD